MGLISSTAVKLALNLSEGGFLTSFIVSCIDFGLSLINISPKSSPPIIGHFLQRSLGLCDFAIASGLTVILATAGTSSFSLNTS